MNRTIFLLSLATGLSSFTVGAQMPDKDDPKSHTHHLAKPPQEAIDACLDEVAKTQCRFEGPKGLELGLCEYTPDEQYFACNPNPEQK